MSSGDGNASELRAWAAATWSADWPDADWFAAERRHGAFHTVLVPPRGSVVLRVAHGNAHARRTVREAAALDLFAPARLPLRVPRRRSAPLTGPLGTGLLVERVPGRPGGETWDPGLWSGLLAALDAVDVADVSHDLFPERAWCGGADWGVLVARLSAAQPSGIGEAASRVVADVLALPPAPRRLCHGDLGPHNVLFTGEHAASLIDTDHACVGDRAIDVAPLIGAFGAHRVATIVDSELLQRAMVHRASLPLQVAAAAHLVGDDALAAHALGNFAQRWRSGTAYDPGGQRPS